MSRVAALLLLLGAACTVPSADSLPPLDAPTDTCTLRLSVSYGDFHPGCLTVTVTDQADPNRKRTEQLEVTPGRPRDTLTADFTPAQGWSCTLSVQARAREQSCAGQEVATQSLQVELSRGNVLERALSLQAVDVDQDGFVSAAAPQRGTDCDDNNAQVSPLATELCDGKDNNCRNGADEFFALGQRCLTSQSCTGSLVCDPNSASGTSCAASQLANAWYADMDGDGYAGTDVGLSCIPPAPTAVRVSTDCDDKTRFSAPGATEVCDGLDNDCDRLVDESCAPQSWSARTITPSLAQWHAVAPISIDRAWVAGNNRLALMTKFDGGSFGGTIFSDCIENWVSAWTRPSDGRVFLGSGNGMLATRSPTEPCVKTQVPGAGYIHGLTGIEAGGRTVLYAVDANGALIRWDYPSAPVIVDYLPAYLYAVHGTSVNSLLAVGFQELSDRGHPVAFRYNPDGGRWLQEDLSGAIGSVDAGVYLSFNGVHVVNDSVAYAVGNEGLVLQRYDGGWFRMPSPSLSDGGTPTLQDVNAFGYNTVYTVSYNGSIYWFDGGSWREVYAGSSPLLSIGGVHPHGLWASGYTPQVIHWGAP